MDRNTIGVKYGNKKLMNTKIPITKKYKHVRPTFKAGPTINDIEVLSDKIISKKKGELFKRIKCSTLNKLLNQQPQDPESIYGLVGSNKEESKEEIKDTQSEYSISQQSGVSAITVATQDLGLNSETTFLLLDLRDPDEFVLAHIIECMKINSS